MKSYSILLAAAAALCLAASPGLAQGMTGRYAVTLVTETGACDAKFNWAVGVIDGEIAESGPFARATGQVNTNGRVVLSVAKGTDTLTASGHLSGQGGNGTWTSPSRGCSGSWRAEKN